MTKSSYLVAAAAVVQLLSLRTQAMEPVDGDSSLNGDRSFDLTVTSAAPALPVHIEFEPGASDIAGLAESGRAQLARALAALPPGTAVVVEGHTCACPAAGESGKLSQLRAEEVRQYLIDTEPSQSPYIYLKIFDEANPPAGQDLSQLDPARCAIDERHTMARAVVIRELQHRDLEATARLIPPVGLQSLQMSMWYRRARPGSHFERLSSGTVLHSGDEIKLFLRADEPAYAYVFHYGSGGDWTCLFPNADLILDQPHNNPLEPGRKYWVPELGRGLPLDTTPGIEETFAFVSSGPDAKMEQWVRQGAPMVISEPTPVDAETVAAGVVQVRPDIDGVKWFSRIKFHHEP